MTADRLTIETARVGMRVRCVDGSGNARLGLAYVVDAIEHNWLLISGHGLERCIAQPSRFIPADPDPAAETDTSIGWLFFNPDTGIEYSDQHPIHSGECEDARNICPATAQNLLGELRNAWQAIADCRGEVEHHRARPEPSWATEELKDALVKAHSDARSAPLTWAPAADLIRAICKAPGLLPKPPSTTAREASISGEWWV